MAINIPADIEERILEKVERGDFPDAGEVIREAMRLLDEQEQELEQLQAKLQIGLDQLDQGEHVLFTPELMDQLRREVNDRLRRGEQPNPDVVP
jgi:antitoxin ParD1/3/4